MSSNSLKGKVVAVTGAASGIGYATALKLLASGASITAGDINGDALHAAFKPLESQYPSTLLCLQVDTTKRSEIQRFIRETKEKYGQLNGYANVAGTGGHRLGHDDITETSDEEYDFIMDVNTRATFFTLSEVLRPGIIAEPNGSIVCVGSMFSQRGFKRGAVFAASKHAMTGMVKSAALEVGSRGIRVNTVLPGAIDTAMHRKNMESDMPDPTPSNPIPRLGSAEEVANVIVFLIGGDSAYVTGAEFVVDGGANV